MVLLVAPNSLATLIRALDHPAWERSRSPWLWKKCLVYFSTLFVNQIVFLFGDLVTNGIWNVVDYIWDVIKDNFWRIFENGSHLSSMIWSLASLNHWSWLQSREPELTAIESQKLIEIECIQVVQNWMFNW